MVILRSRIKSPLKAGFTLVELSIVLVIIGLIIGGVLVGRDLIDAAAVRAQISQIEKYNSAVETFRNKYGYLPGDMPYDPANQFGLPPRCPPARCPTLYPGYFDGDGLIEGNNSYLGNGPTDNSGVNFNGETVFVQSDLSAAKLINGYYATSYANGDYHCDDTHIPQCYPAAKMGNGNYIYAWSGGISASTSASGGVGDGHNYWGISVITSISAGGNYMMSNPGMTVQQAYNIDKKMDDGLPQSGRVQAFYLNSNIPTNEVRPVWAGTTIHGTPPYTTSTPGSSTTCFDNSSTTGAQQYSMGQNNGAGLNCGLSFQFQ